MSLKKRLLTMLVVLIIFIPMNTATASAFGNFGKHIDIDGYDDDWSDKPYSWEYPNDNDYPDGQYQYDINSRHQMSLYCDDDYAYLHIELCTKEKSGLNGQNFQFWCDGYETVFELSYVGGYKINKNDKNDPGIYSLEVRNDTGILNNTVVQDASADYTIKAGHENNEMELKIPLTAFSAQDSRIDRRDIKQIAFFCPYLMYRRIYCSGVSTDPYIGIAICLLVVGGIILFRKRGFRSKKV